MKLFFICLFIFCIPSFSFAAIIINEIAWMGTDTSTNDEWIELYNNGNNSVNVDGWLLSDGVNFEVVLTGSVAAGQYAVLERTDDTSAPGAAFLVYVGSLSNTGATLSLYRTDNSLEDRVVGGENWENIGGDNITKETSQYTSNGWITAPATPGVINQAIDIPVPEEDTAEESPPEPVAATSKGTSGSGSSGPPILFYTTQRNIELSLTVPERAYVHQEIVLEAGGSGVSDTILNSLSYDWNFGDFNTAHGKEVTHRFEYPGEYVVTVHSQFQKYDAYARKTIVVLPTSFSITTNANGDVQVHNDAPYEVDASHYKIVAGKTLSFPKGTILLPNATITIPKKKIGSAQNKAVTLFDDMATVVASLLRTQTLEPKVVTVQNKKEPLHQQVMSVPSSDLGNTPASSFTFVDEGDTEQKVLVQPEPQPLNTQQVAAVIEATDAVPEGKLPYLALLAVIGLGILSVFAGRHKTDAHQ